MSLFKDMLKDNESLFTSNVEALDFDYLPKLVPFREQEQERIALCIKPLFQKRNGKNILVHGKPGIGKTVAVRHLLKDLEEQTDEIFPVYINCWQHNTSYKVMLEICSQLNYKFTQNKKTEELMKVVKDIVNKNAGAVFVFDEVDKVEESDFLYSLSEEIYRKAVVLITNFKEWFGSVDERTKSRLIPEVLEFREYNMEETAEILRQRLKYAFVPGVWRDDAFMLIAGRAFELRDIRRGLHLLREAGQHAEGCSKKSVELGDAEFALSKIASFSKKDSSGLLDDEKEILGLVKLNSGARIGDLFRIYSEKNEASYKTFQRKIKKLEENNFVSVERVDGGSEGNTSIIRYGEVKKLTEF